MVSNTLRIGDGRDWHFVNGAWEDGEGGEMAVPEGLRRSDGCGLQGHHYAFNRRLACKNVTVRFEFRLTAHSDIGVILRARDESHFYLLHFPNCGQASRAQHFWVAFSKMDESGYLRLIKLEMVRRVPSNKGLWLPAKLTLRGGKISVEIGDNGHFEARDNTFADPGRIGVYSVGDASLRNVVVRGEPTASSPWNEQVRQRTNWFHPCPDTEYGLWQKPTDLLRLPGGELLLNYSVQERAYEGASTPLLTRSYNGGHSWSKPEVLHVARVEDVWSPARLHLTPNGRLICLFRQGEGYLTAESKDGTRTWSEPAPAGIGPVPPKVESLHVGPQGFVDLADGSMVLFCYGKYRLEDPDLTILTWGSLHCQAFACRSTDDGRTWSRPVNVDHGSPDAVQREDSGNLDLTEVCGVQMGNGRIMALIRPIYSPWMWETWSSDGGASWSPCVRGPFPGYATPNVLRTSSGAVLVAHRLSSMTIHSSRDDGHTWDQGTMIDGSIWVMGSMIEIEPDVVLYVYWDSFESLMRAQFIRVTRTGLEPVAR